MIHTYAHLYNILVYAKYAKYTTNVYYIYVYNHEHNIDLPNASKWCIPNIYFCETR